MKLWEALIDPGAREMTADWCRKPGPMLPRHGAWIPAMLLGVLIAGPSLACPDLRAQAIAAQQASDIAAMRRLHAAIKIEPACDDAFRSWLSDVVARALMREGLAALEDGTRQREGEVLLRASLDYQAHWQALATLGDLVSDRGDFATATVHYQRALVEIANEEATPQAPEPGIIERIFRRAEESRLLADRYVATPVGRDNRPGALAARKIRGLVVEAVAVPITFEFGKTELTAKGDAAARDMLRHLEAEGSPPITLVGHTDPVGDAAYNMKLSLARAEAVRDFLRRSAYAGEVRIAGRGEEEPPVLSDGGRYDQEQRHQLARRVVLKR